MEPTTHDPDHAAEDLAEVQHQIDDAKRGLADLEHKNERHFIDTGTEDTENVDDAIAPPG